jgi:hypothetical protein
MQIHNDKCFGDPMLAKYLDLPRTPASQVPSRTSQQSYEDPPMQDKHQAMINAKESLYEQRILLNDPDDPTTTWHKLSAEVKAKALLALHLATSIDLFTLYKILSGARAPPVVFMSCLWISC